jgi:hypothetical protein
MNKWMDAGLPMPQTGFAGGEFPSNQWEGAYEDDGENEGDPLADSRYYEEDLSQDLNSTVRRPIAVNTDYSYPPNILQPALHNLPDNTSQHLFQITSNNPLHDSQQHAPQQHTPQQHTAQQHTPQLMLPAQCISQFSVEAAAAEAQSISASQVSLDELNRHLSSQTHMVCALHV